MIHRTYGSVSSRANDSATFCAKCRIYGALFSDRSCNGFNTWKTVFRKKIVYLLLVKLGRLIGHLTKKKVVLSNYRYSIIVNMK